MIYLYGLLHPDAASSRIDLAALNGVTGPVQVSHIGLGKLIHGPAPDSDILPKRRHLLAHARVLEAFNDQGTVLPMRFGMSAPGVAQVGAMIAHRHTEIAASFKRLDGAIELGLNIRFPRDPALAAVLAENRALAAERDRLARRKPPPHFEAAELGGKLAEALDRRRGVAQRALLAELVPQVRDHVLRAPEEDTHVLSADVLIGRHEEAGFSKAVEAAAQACNFAPGAEPEIRLVGPVPAYNFVRLTLNADVQEAVA